MQARAAATLEGSPVVPADEGGVATAGGGTGSAGGGVGLADFGMLHVEERRAGLSRELGWRFWLSRRSERPYARRVVNPVIVRTGARSYEVVIGPGILEQAGLLISRKLKGPQCAVVTDENVAAFY